MLNVRSTKSAVNASSASLLALQDGDVSSGADFARAKRHKKLSARLNSPTARSKIVRLQRHSIYVLLFLILTHTGAFIATRVLLGDEKSHVASVRMFLGIEMLGIDLLFHCRYSHK